MPGEAAKARSTRILVVGGGGREHALAWGLRRYAGGREIWSDSDNPGILQFAHRADLADKGIDSLADWAVTHNIDFTVVGPEAELAAGIVDTFRARRLAIFGPDRAAAQLEWSKGFAKELMLRHQVPTARFAICESAGVARQKALDFGLPVVVKADGLAAGKGVTICYDRPELEATISHLMVENVFGAAGGSVVVEEYLEGAEVCVHALASGVDFVMLPVAQDHKAVYDGGRGPNTGGMGAYSPVPFVGPVALADIATRIIKPILAAMAAAGTPYCGALKADLMISAKGPQVLEFNCRFGDPEAQVLIPRLESDLLELLAAVAGGRLQEVEARWTTRAAVCVVLASGGYPGRYETGIPITGAETAADESDVMLFHAGTAGCAGELVTAGGRVMGVTALGDTIDQARHRAYRTVAGIDFAGMHYRRDIAAQTEIR